MIKSKLERNKTIKLLSLSSGIAGEEAFLPRYNIGKKRIEELTGCKAEETENSLKGVEFILNNPEARANDLNESFKDQNVTGVIANIGGLDSHLLWEFIDQEAIKNNPKFLMGYSDTTSVHLMLYKLGIQSYYGPAVLDGFAENVEMHEFTKKHFLEMAFGDGKYILDSNSNEWTSEYLEWTVEENNSIKRKLNKEQHGHIWKGFDENIIEAELLGGCLDVLIGITDLEFYPTLDQWKDKAIFLETSESKITPEEYEKAILKIKDELDVAKVLLIGKPKDEEYFNEYLDILNKHINTPFIYNMNFGHTAPMLTIPYGGKVIINPTIKIIKFGK